MIQHLHPTLKKCGCGYIGNKDQLYKHLKSQREFYNLVGDMKKFYVLHGEVPLNEAEGEAWQNAKWLEGTPKGYND